jgi:hypothetical protein
MEYGMGKLDAEKVLKILSLKVEDLISFCLSSSHAVKRDIVLKGSVDSNMDVVTLSHLHL